MAELGPDFEDDDFGFGFGEEALQVVDDHVDGVGGEDPVAYFAVLLDSYVDYTDALEDWEIIRKGKKKKIMFNI